MNITKGIVLIVIMEYLGPMIICICMYFEPIRRLA